MDSVSTDFFLPELLAPAGELEHLKAAICAGADAVYIGGQQFGARAYASNFSKEEITQALHFAHFYGKKIYLTVNTLLKEQELTEQLFDYLFPLYEEGLDGVIVQDFGAAAFIREQFPCMEIHGSTQMTISNSYGARAAARMGMSRVVPARELSYKEVKKIREESGLEVEVFVHGALCYCYSGQCLLSSFDGNRSGNRGRCAQPCRLPYSLCRANGEKIGKMHGQYLLSPRDLCLLPNLMQLIELPVDSLKIEGRMKNAEYVAGVTSIYRKYLDEYKRIKETGGHFRVNAKDMHDLEELYCRGSFTSGYGNRHNGSDMMASVSPKNTGRKIGEVVSVRKNKVQIRLFDTVYPKDVLVLFLTKDGQKEIILTVPSDVNSSFSRGNQIELNTPEGGKIRPGMSVFRRHKQPLCEKIQNTFIGQRASYPVDAVLRLKPGTKTELELVCQKERVVLNGPVPEKPQKSPLSQNEISRQMNKTGQVPFFLNKLQIIMEEDCFLPISAIKKLRQNGFALLQKTLEERGKRDPAVFHHPVMNDAMTFPSVESEERIATVYDCRQFELCLRDDFFDSICLPWDFFAEEKLIKLAKKGMLKGKRMYLAMPRVFRTQGRTLEKICCNTLWYGIYVYNINEAEYLDELDLFHGKMITGASFYHWNASSVYETQRLFPSIYARELSVELSEKEIAQFLTSVHKEKRTGGFEIMIYGRNVLMQSAQCVKKTTGFCDKKPELLFLSDCQERKLPVTTHCKNCCNLIWQENARNLIGEDLSEIADFVNRKRFDLFRVEDQELSTIKKNYILWEANGFRADTKKTKPDTHWMRGIE
ncbi:MAG: U32 family peptidase [Eubacterium sp.]|nr:U32 family peptidase [Eubacterium sp.]